MKGSRCRRSGSGGRKGRLPRVDPVSGGRHEAEQHQEQVDEVEVEGQRASRAPRRMAVASSSGAFSPKARIFWVS